MSIVIENVFNFTSHNGPVIFSSAIHVEWTFSEVITGHKYSNDNDNNYNKERDQYCNKCIAYLLVRPKGYIT